MRALYVYLLLVLFLSGCASAPRTGLTVAMNLAEEEWRVFREKIFPLFESDHDISIHAYQISSGQLAAKLEALIDSGKSEIDVFAQDNMSLATLVNRNLVCDLSGYTSDISEHVLPALRDAGVFNSTPFFMPFRPNVQIAYYNDRAFTRAGLRPPRTWDELLAVARAFKEGEGTGQVVVKGYGGNPTATQLYEFILQAGGTPYAFNDEGCVCAFTFLRRLAPYLSPESQRAKWDTVNEILATQQAYLAQNWPFGVRILVKDYGLDYIKTYSGWAGPAGEYHVIGGDVLGIPKNARYKKEARDFIFFLQSKRVQEILVRELGWPSIRDDAYAEVEEWQKPHFSSVQKALEKGVFRDNVTWWPAYAKYISRAYRDIVIEGKDIKTTLARYKRELQKDKERSR